MLQAGCEKSDDVVIDSLSSAPRISNGIIVPSAVNTDTVNIGPNPGPEDVLTLSFRVSAKVTHATGPSSIGGVQFVVIEPVNQQLVASGILHDDGSAPDLLKGDSVFSATVTFQTARSVAGAFSVELSAEAQFGYRSNTVILPFQVLRLNRPPLLSNLIAPDTVQTSSASSFLITVRASDPDGLSDIRSVTRTTPSGLVVFLNDAGTNGDVTPGDGIFTETVSVNPPPPNGTYEFKFQALDRLKSASNIIVKQITIVP